MNTKHDGIKKKIANKNDLIGLFNAGHKKLVPISNDGKIPDLTRFLITCFQL